MPLNKKFLDCDELRTVLPYLYPFLMVDRAMLISEEKRAIGIKNVTINEPFFQGHFPGNPVMPGILILEAMVQTSGVVIRDVTGTKTDLTFLKSISKAKFRKPVMPGDRLMINTALIQFQNGTAKFRASANVLDQQVCQAEFTIDIRENIPETLRIPEFAPDICLENDHLEPARLFDIHKVMNTITHRYPFILVDSILARKPPRIFGLKNVTNNEPFFNGHFPDHPVMPETLLVEAMAQVGAVHILNQPENNDKLGYFLGVNSARFLHPVRPGDQLVIEVDILSTRPRFGKGHGRIHVGKTIVAESTITFVIVDRNSTS